MEKNAAMRLWLCICFLSIMKCTLGDMCGSRSFNPPRYRCCGRPGREQIVYDTTNQMCLQDLNRGFYHVRSVFFPCGNLAKKYDYRSEMCIMDIQSYQFRIIPRFAYCQGYRFDLRRYYCYYDYSLGISRLLPRKRRSVSKNGYFA